MRHLKSKEMSTFDCFHLEFLPFCFTAYRRRICTECVCVWLTYYNAYIHFPTAIIRLLCHRLNVHTYTECTKSERRTCIMAYDRHTVSETHSAFRSVFCFPTPPFSYLLASTVRCVFYVVFVCSVSRLSAHLFEPLLYICRYRLFFAYLFVHTLAHHLK